MVIFIHMVLLKTLANAYSSSNCFLKKAFATFLFSGNGPIALQMSSKRFYYILFTPLINAHLGGSHAPRAHIVFYCYTT